METPPLPEKLKSKSEQMQEQFLLGYLQDMIDRNELRAGWMISDTQIVLDSLMNLTLDYEHRYLPMSNSMLRPMTNEEDTRVFTLSRLKVFLSEQPDQSQTLGSFISSKKS